MKESIAKEQGIPIASLDVRNFSIDMDENEAA
jgi:hypothetical protein